MAADAPGIQIVAINPRKAALELQPNVSRPAITRPSPAKLPQCARNLESKFFPSEAREWTRRFRHVIIAGNRAFRNVNRTYSPHDLAITKQSQLATRDYFSNRDSLSPETLGSQGYRFQ